MALNIIRKRGNAPFLPLGDQAAAQVIDVRSDARAGALIQERIDLLADAMMTLPARCREITVLHKVHGLSQKSIAEQLGISERTVECQVRTGLSRCLIYLQRHGFKTLSGDE